MRKLFSLLAVSGLSLLAFSGFAYADLLEDAMSAVNSLVSGIHGCICAFVYDPTFTSLYFAFDPSNVYWNADLRFCSEIMASQGRECGDVSFTCTVEPQGDYDYLISCSSFSSSGNNPFPLFFSCSSFLCYLDLGGSGSGSGSACQSVNNLIDTLQGVKEGFLKVFIGSSFAFGLLGGAYAVLRVVF
jgi:hypothetical protein